MKGETNHISMEWNEMFQDDIYKHLRVQK